MVLGKAKRVGALEDVLDEVNSGVTMILKEMGQLDVDFDFPHPNHPRRCYAQGCGTDAIPVRKVYCRTRRSSVSGKPITTVGYALFCETCDSLLGSVFVKGPLFRYLEVY